MGGEDDRFEKLDDEEVVGALSHPKRIGIARANAVELVKTLADELNFDVERIFKLRRPKLDKGVMPHENE